MIGVSVTMADDAVRTALARVQARTGNLEPMLDVVGAAQVTSTQERFEAQRGPDGQAWRGLAERTLELRQARGASSPQILRDSGELYDSLTHQAEPTQVAWGSNRAYARIHQLGGQAGRGRKSTIPAREFLGLSDDDRAEVLRIAREHVEGT